MSRENPGKARPANGTPARIAYLLASLAILAILVGLFRPGELHAINQKEELELGRAVHLQIAKDDALFSDPYVNQYFQKVAGRLVRAAPKQSFPFHFYLVKSNTLNAFAVPGGYIYFHTETINSLENEGQMAAILAHEIAHITSRHFSRRAEKSSAMTMASLAGIVAGALLASSGGHNSAALGQAVMLGATGATIQSMLANSRADESEADRKGRDYMLKAGYHPKDMYGAFRIMNEKSFSLSSKIPSYLSTHPGISSRLASTFADQENAPKSPPDPAFLAVRDRVLALTAAPERAINTFQARLKENPADASALHGLGLVATRSNRFQQAEKYFRDALAASPGNGEYLSDLGALYFQLRKPEQALTEYQAALKSGDGTPQTCLGLARTSEILGKTAEAASYYDRAVSAAGENFPPALEAAGTFFMKRGENAKGHFILGNYFIQMGKIKEAVFHYEAALKTPSPYTAQINQIMRDLEPFTDKKKS
ncbi:MAG: M48 family metalloprotease [Deltaproteobacteria bacterium]|nr:M48 family metalloprotease [Deltaproteobacteria bacterium]